MTVIHKILISSPTVAMEIILHLRNITKAIELYLVFYLMSSLNDYAEYCSLLLLRALIRSHQNSSHHYHHQRRS